MDFQIGEKIIHCSHGLGEIIKIDEKMVNEHKDLYYVIQVRDLTIWVKAEAPAKSTIRHPTPGNDFETLFKILRTPGTPLPVDRNERRNLLIKLMKEGQITTTCSIIRDLADFGKDNKINEHDKSIFEQAQSALLTEWAYSRSISTEQAKDELNQMLGVIS